MISKSNPLASSATLSTTASLDNKKSADVPSVTFSRTSFMKSVDTDVGEGTAHATHQGADHHPEDGNEEDQPEEQPPEGAVQGTETGQVVELAGPGLALSLGPGGDRHIHDLDQLLLLQVLQFVHHPVGAVGLREF